MAELSVTIPETVLCSGLWKAPLALTWAVSTPKNLTHRNLAEQGTSSKGHQLPHLRHQHSQLWRGGTLTAAVKPHQIFNTHYLCWIFKPRHTGAAEGVGVGGGVGASHLIHLHSWVFGCRCKNKQFTSRYCEGLQPLSTRQETPLSLRWAALSRGTRALCMPSER